MINFIVVEDNKLHAKNIKNLIIKYMMANKYYFDVFLFDKDDEFLMSFINNDEDNKIYILDFELQGTNAIEISRKIRKNDWVSPIIIFTAHGGMAFETFKQRLQILDFVSKQYKSDENLISLFDLCISQINTSRYLKINYKNNIYNIKHDHIIYIYRDSIERKVIIVTNNKEYKVRINLKEIKKKLPKYFKYSDKACIINTRRAEIYDWKNYQISFDNGLSIGLLSKTHKKELLQ